MKTIELQIDSGNAKHWYQNGKHHREDGPAMEYSDGGKLWYKMVEYCGDDTK